MSAALLPQDTVYRSLTHDVCAHLDAGKNIKHTMCMMTIRIIIAILWSIDVAMRTMMMMAMMMIVIASCLSLLGSIV